MRIVAVAVAVAATSGCMLGSPEIVYHVDAPPRAEAAIVFGMNLWGYDLGPLGEPPPVAWFDVDCVDYDRNDKCLAGTYWVSPEQIELVYREKPSDSALVHELLHMGLYRKTGDPDGAHEDRLWGKQSRYQQLMREAGM